MKCQTGAVTTQRLLEAATAVFAEVGYSGATLREICRRAQANIAAVNYHFHDKEQLYAAVLSQAIVASGEDQPLLTPNPDEPPEQRLRYFIGKFMNNLLGEDRPVDLLRLMTHEMVEPTHALPIAIDKAVRPVNAILYPILTDLLGAAATPLLVRDCAGSVLSQCAAYYNSEVLIQRLHGMNVHDRATIEGLADHIFRFSLGGIRAMAQSGQPVRTTQQPNGEGS